MLELLLRIMSCALILNNHVHSINPAKTVASLWKKKVHPSIHTVIWDLGSGTQNGLDLNFNLEGARSSVRILSEWEQKTFQGNLNWITKIFARKSRHTCRKIHLIHFYNSIFSEWTILGTAQQDLWTRWMQVFIQLKNKNKCENYIWQSFITSSCSSVGDNQEAKINGSIGQASYLRHRLQKVARKTFPTLKDMLKGSSMIFVLEI